MFNTNNIIQGSNLRCVLPEYKNTILAIRMGGSTLAVFNGKDYQGWTEDLDYYLMGQGLKDAGDSERMLGIFISHGGKLVKETYNLLNLVLRGEWEKVTRRLRSVCIYMHGT